MNKKYFKWNLNTFGFATS